jgi:IS5 family transposase
MRFLGLTISDTVPDAKTIWNFKNELSKSVLVEKLFSILDKTLTQRGVILNKGKMIDASIVEVPIQRNSREENDQLKDGKTPEGWQENKLRQKDVDAKWTRKNGKNYYGYKDHIKADIKTKLITGYTVTPANIYDNVVIDELISKQDRGQKLYADSAYRSEKIEANLKEKKVISMIHEKGYRYKKLTKAQEKRNTGKSKVRARVEHIFGFMANSMRGKFIRCRSLIRARATIGLMNITYNLFRVVQLKVTI